MTEAERNYLCKRLDELLQKRAELVAHQGKLDKEIQAIKRKLNKN